MGGNNGNATTTAAGTDGGAALIRACNRRLRWAVERTLLGRARVAADVLTWPLRAMLSSARQAARRGPAVRSAHGIPLRRQFLRLVGYSLRHGRWPEYWYKFKLYLPDRAARAAGFVCDEVRLVHMYLNEGPEQNILWDKPAFASACRERGLPHIPTVAVIRDGRIIEPAAGLAADALPREDLFMKPADGKNGVGTECWQWRGDGSGVGVYERVGGDGETLDPAALLARLANESRTRPLVVQRRATNHPAIAALSSGPLSTIRVVTGRPVDGEPRVLRAALRMPVGTRKCVDNFDAGGIAAPVDLATGRLGPACAKDPVVPATDTHPDTGNRITGSVLPYWDAAVDLCLRAQRAFPTLATVGWDVAILPDGPILVEGNPRWGFTLVQMPHGAPLCDTEFGSIVAGHIARKVRQQRQERDRQPEPRPVTAASTAAAAMAAAAMMM